MKTIRSIFWIIAAILILYIALGPFPATAKIIFIFFSMLFIYPIALFIRTVLPRYASRKMHKRIGIDENDFDQAPSRYFYLRKKFKLLKMLNKRIINSIEILKDREIIYELKTENEISAFQKFFPGHMVFSIGQDFNKQTILQINSGRKPYHFEAYTSDNSNDVILKFSECGDYGGIKLPCLKRWLDENVFTNKE